MTALVTEHLPLVAGAPEGIRKLRELILELAVRGNLVPQSCADEPADALLVEAKAEGSRFAKKQRASTPVPGAVPFGLPTGWVWSRFNDLIAPEFPIAYGVLVPGPEATDGVPFVRIGDLDLLAPNALPEKRISHEVDAQFARTRLRGGEILMGVVGSIGKLGVAPSTWAGANIARAICRIVPTSAMSTSYVLWLLQTQFMRAQFLGDTRTLAQPTLNVGLIREALTPVPPLAEQHRIVAKIDELMALCDRLEADQADAEAAHAQLVQALLDSLTQATDAADFRALWQRLSEHFHTLFTTEASIDALKQTVLQLGVMGKLVPQDRSEEAASGLLSRIRSEKVQLAQAGLVTKPKPSAPVDLIEQSFLLPNGWAWARFQDFALDVATGPFGSLIHQSDYVDNGVPLINPSHMIDGRIRADFNVALSEEMADRLSSYKLRAGDVVMARRGEVGRVALVTDTEAGWLCGTGSFVLRFHADVSRAYVRTLFACASTRRYLAGAAVGTTMVNLNHGILLNLPVAVPPSDEQHRIVAKVDELMALCDQLKAQLADARQQHAQLATALIEQAVA